jgi:hypothetical protein
LGLELSKRFLITLFLLIRVRINVWDNVTVRIVFGDCIRASIKLKVMVEVKINVKVRIGFEVY